MSDHAVSVRTGARLHIGFRNLSPARRRLFGGIGLAVEEPRVSVIAEPASEVECEHPRGRRVARRVVESFALDGATVAVVQSLPPHEGFGSGTQLSLAVGTAIARSHGIQSSVRDLAKRLDRGGRSGVGVACFAGGGFVVDGGHPIEDVDDDVTGSTVPDPVIRESIPDDWRFVLVHPTVDPGRSGNRETTGIRRAIETADPGPAERIEELLTSKVVPGIQGGDIEAFGDGITRIDALTGKWFAAAQGKAYRPPCDRLIEEIAQSTEIAGYGQSSWGPLCYGVTTSGGAERAVTDCKAALSRVGVAGSVTTTTPRNRGAAIEVTDESTSGARPT